MSEIHCRGLRKLYPVTDDDIEFIALLIAMGAGHWEAVQMGLSAIGVPTHLYSRVIEEWAVHRRLELKLLQNDLDTRFPVHRKKVDTRNQSGP